MSSTFPPADTAAAGWTDAPVRPARSGGAAPRLATPPRRRTPLGRLALGVTLVLLCGGVLAVQFSRAQHRSAVLAVARPVAAGEAIVDADLRVAQVAADGLSTVSAADRAQVVGRIAAVDLRPGQNITPEVLTGAPLPGPGEIVIGVLFKPGQLPGRSLSPGDRVRLVTTGTADRGATAPAVGAQERMAGAVRDARVVLVTLVTTVGDGSVVVDLLLGEADGPQVAADAAAGELSLLLTPRAG